MSMRKKSLLDAFRAVPPAKGAAPRPVETQARPQRTVPPPEPPRAMAPGPIPARVVAPQPPAPPPPPRATPPRAPEPRPAPTPRATAERVPISRDRIVLLGLAAITVVVVVAMMMKHGHDGDVSADAGNAATPPLAQSPASAPAASPLQGGAEVGSTAQDRAFLDKKNKVTIRVGQFDNDPSGTAAAQAAYRYLLTEGANVVRPMVGVDADHIVLCVGAKPRKSDLEGERTWLHGLRGPSGGKKLPYADAWIDNIDNVVRR